MLALLPLLAVAGMIEPGAGAKLLGWSADGQFLVWTSNDAASSFPKHYVLIKGDDRIDVPDPSKLSAEDRAKVEVEDGEVMMGAEPTTDETAVVATVHDARSGADQQFLLEYKAVSKVGKATGTLKKKYA